MESLSLYAHLESNVRSYCRSTPIEFEKGYGSYLYDVKGLPYLDFLAGCGSLNYGHNDADMKAALISYLESNGLALGLDFHTTAKSAFLRSFNDLILSPRKLDYKVQFTGPTGTNAVEAALKLARKYTGQPNIISFTNGFHGCSLGALAATGNSKHRATSESQLGNVYRAYYDGYLGKDIDTADLLERILQDPSGGVGGVAAIIFESIQGEGGLNHASAVWAKKISAIAKRHHALLIIDEIQAGCGRSGDFFSFEPLGIKPDIVTMSKSISGFGLPMAIVLISPEIDVWSPGEHNGTFRGNSHAFVTANVMLQKFWKDDHFSARLKIKEKVIKEWLTKLSLKTGFKVKGRGLMQGLDVESSTLAKNICRECLRKGLILETCGSHSQIIKLFMPLTISSQDLEMGLDIIEHAIYSSMKKSSVTKIPMVSQGIF